MGMVARLGGGVTAALDEVGEVARLLAGIVRSTGRIVRDRALIVDQMAHIGVGSLPLVLVIGVFTGAVAAWQASYQFSGMGISAAPIIGSAVTRAIILELGPVLTGIVIAGRVGASIAAELGTMRVTEQIDALEAMAISPVRYLAMPRFLAAVVMMPILDIFAVTVAVLGAFLVSHLFLDISAGVFFGSAQRFFRVSDVFGSMGKTAVFGAITALMGCHIGFATEGGAEGVGRSTIRAFVASSALILVADYFLWTLLF